MDIEFVFGTPIMFLGYGVILGITWMLLFSPGRIK